MYYNANDKFFYLFPSCFLLCVSLKKHIFSFRAALANQKSDVATYSTVSCLLSPNWRFNDISSDYITKLRLWETTSLVVGSIHRVHSIEIRHKHTRSPIKSRVYSRRWSSWINTHDTCNTTYTQFTHPCSLQTQSALSDSLNGELNHLPPSFLCENLKKIFERLTSWVRKEKPSLSALVLIWRTLKLILRGLISYKESVWSVRVEASRMAVQSAWHNLTNPSRRHTSVSGP